MNENIKIYNKIMSRPQKQYTREESEARLRKIGILNERNEVSEQYKELFVKKGNAGERR